MKRAAALSGALLLSLAACGGPGVHTRAGGAVSPLAVRPVAWSAGHVPLGKVRAVADAGNVVAVFSDQGATVLASRAVVATDPAMKGCVDAATIAGADGSARWIVGVDAKGHLHRLRDASRFEDVTDRYGLAGPAREVRPLGGRYVAFGLGSGVAVADGSTVARYATGPLTGLAGGGQLGVGVAADGLHVLDVARGTATTFPLEGATYGAIDAKGRLYAATPRAVYAADDKGQLALVYESDAESIHGLVASGDVVWFADGPELGVVDGARVRETAGAGVAKDARLASSSSGDVWVVSDGGLSRYERAAATGGAPAPPAASVWSSTIAPVFARSCSACHLPDGESGTDLSTEAAWGAERAAIRERVVVGKTMPPDGHPLSDADREAIRAWVEDAPPSSVGTR